MNRDLGSFLFKEISIYIFRRNSDEFSVGDCFLLLHLIRFVSELFCISVKLFDTLLELVVVIKFDIFSGIEFFI